MKRKHIFLLGILFLTPLSLNAQTTAQELETQRMVDDQRARDRISDQKQMESFERLQIIVQASHESNVEIIRRDQSVSFRYKPRLTKDDIKAISIHPADAIQFASFLRQPKTGIVRLQSADVCLPNNLVIQANGTCPNNIIGKATSYSFRTKDYTSATLSDVFFNKTKLSSTGVFTIGMFSNLGDVDLDALTLTSDGIKQLAEYQPSVEQSEIEKESEVLTKGLKIDGRIFKNEMEVKENTSYVLRTVAYKGKLYKGTGFYKIDVLAADKRKDVIVVFRITRIQDDGSITLIWKELNEKPSPRVVLKGK
jgi:hypothetical protein